jgi:hypothetical protein
LPLGVEKLIPDSRQLKLVPPLLYQSAKPSEAVMLVTPCPAPLMVMFLFWTESLRIVQEPAPMLIVVPVVAAEIAERNPDVMSPIHDICGRGAGN